MIPFSGSYETEMTVATQLLATDYLLDARDRNIGARPSLALARSISQGVSVAALERIARRIAPDDPGFVFRIVPKATLTRRRKAPGHRLHPDEGERLARVSRVFDFACEVLGDETRARVFLTRAHPMLDGDTPLDVALATGPGAEVVLNVLGRAAYGSAA